jgi:hypothetical protein
LSPYEPRDDPDESLSLFPYGLSDLYGLAAPDPDLDEDPEKPRSLLSNGLSDFLKEPSPLVLGARFPSRGPLFPVLL